MLIRNLKVSRLLSFGPEGIDLALRPLNVLIGANGSGKSNFIEVLNLLRYAPVRFDAPIMTGGGIKEWIWKTEGIDSLGHPSLEVVVCNNLPKATVDIRHRLDFNSSGERVVMEYESIADDKPLPGEEEVWWYYLFQDGRALLHDSELPERESLVREIETSKLDPRISILSQMRDPDRYQVFEYLQRAYNGIHIYRDWIFGPGAKLRSSQIPDGPGDAVGRWGENLISIIASMKRAEKNRMLGELRSLYEEIVDIQVSPAGGGAMQLFIEEKGGIQISAERLSDGTLRFLFLLAILLQSNPPPMIVIEEPELGLHPDVIPKLAALLIEASERTQIVITTHSRTLVDALGDDPESVIVCEKHHGESTFERLDGERMKVWLEKYSLGDLWSKGEIGGNRW